MAGYYSDLVVSQVSDVDRAMHNDTEFVRLALQRPQAETAHGGNVSSPDSLTSTPHYIDGSYTASPTTGIDLIRVGYASGQRVDTTEFVVYTIQPLDDDEANWEVATSLDGTDAQFSLDNFKATNLSVLEEAVTLDSVDQFKYTITFTAPAIGGLRYWRVKRLTENLNDVTEVEPVPPLTPTISLHNTGGVALPGHTFEQPNILDACWDSINDVFYTIRYNAVTQGTTTVTLGDDFSDADAGTASGTTGFNPSRWIQDSTHTSFLRVSDELLYNTADGNGQLDTTYTLEDFTTTIDVNPQTVTTEDMWFALRAVDGDDKVLVQEGVGRETVASTSGVIFATALENFTDLTADSQMTDLRPLWHNCASGTDQFSITYSGSVWTVTGTLTGALTDATTGVLYDESTDANTPTEFLISYNGETSPGQGESFTFDLVTDHVKRMPVTATGLLSISRTGSNFTTHNVFSSPRSISSDAVTIELFGNTDGVVDISADNYAVATGSGTFPSVGVFTVERTDNEGDLVAGNPTVLEAFDVIGDPSLGYNDFLDGRVQIAATSSGSGGGFIYIKYNNSLYKYANSVAILGIENGGSAVSPSPSIGQIATDGTHSLAWTKATGATGDPFLTYVEYDETLGTIQLKTIDKDTLLDTSDTKKAFLDMSGYSTDQEFRVFYNQNDFDTLYYVDASYNLQSFSLDDTISAFMAVNAEDTTLPAGTSQQTLVNADVINAWGEILSGKTVTFTVTAGDGAVSPATDTTDGAGRATTTFAVGSTVGVSTVTATVGEA
jgi:hypothetical protein